MESKILITGSNGQLGRAMNQVLKEQHSGITIINSDMGEPTAYCPIILDITNPVAVMNLIQDLKPEIIINCAAHTAVDLCESDQDRAYKINAIGPKNLAIAANAVEAKLVQISTDYVFDGKAKAPYTEEDTTNPESVYGSTKLAGEEFVKEFCDRHFIVRTAWLYGEGKNFVRTMLGLAEKNSELRVVGDQFGSPTSTYELAKAITFLIKTEEYGIFHATCEGITTWNEFAEEIFRIANKEVTVQAISSEEYSAPAARPTYSVLENKRLKGLGYRMKPWKEALQKYMNTQGNK